MLRSLVSTSSAMSRSLCKRLCSTETLKPSFDTLPNENTSNQSTESTSEGFETLLRKSAFIQMGDPVGKVILSNQTDTMIIICQMIFQQVVGKIYHVVDDDLYIDFGGKV